MISFPNCKVNLGLHIVEKRSDGYHNLETVFYPLPFTDILEIIPAIEQPGDQSTATQPLSLSMSGLPVAGDRETNLCFKAWQVLKKDFPQLPPVSMHLHKKIPMGAGLGGGSADGAFALVLLNQMFQLKLSKKALADYALLLGSDCPFFIYNTPAFASGRGELMESLQLDLGQYSWLIINPGIHIGTAQAFSRIVPKPAPSKLVEVVSRPVAAWKELLRNDFEDAAFFYYPFLREVKQWLYDNGALYASMTGSGSCFFGIFKKNQLPQTSSVSNWHSYPIP